MTTAKVRVYEVARELGVDNNELMRRFATLGIHVRNHMSALEPAEIDRVKRLLEKDKQQKTVEERIRPTVVRRRAARQPAGAPPEAETAEPTTRSEATRSEATRSEATRSEATRSEPVRRERSSRVSQPEPELGREPIRTDESSPRHSATHAPSESVEVPSTKGASVSDSVATGPAANTGAAAPSVAVGSAGSAAESSSPSADPSTEKIARRGSDASIESIPAGTESRNVAPSASQMGASAVEPSVERAAQLATQPEHSEPRTSTAETTSSVRPSQEAAASAKLPQSGSPTESGKPAGTAPQSEAAPPSAEAPSTSSVQAPQAMPSTQPHVAPKSAPRPTNAPSPEPRAAGEVRDSGHRPAIRPEENRAEALERPEIRAAEPRSVTSATGAGSGPSAHANVGPRGTQEARGPRPMDRPTDSRGPRPSGPPPVTRPNGDFRDFRNEPRPGDRGAPRTSNRPSQPPPASVRLGHSNLPPGVVTRGNVTAPSAPLPSAEARARIVNQHAAAQQVQRPYSPDGTQRRRVEVNRSSLGPAARPQPGQRPGGKRRPVPGKKGAKTEITTPSAQKRIIRIEDNIALQGLAQKMSLKATDVLMKLLQMGMGGVNINSTLDSDTAKIIASEFGYEVENVAKTDDELIKEARNEDLTAEMIPRPPIVTVMGHVDHGKTSLLDQIRKANVVSSEAGGITQHIGAYRVDTAKGPIVFLDTPGHEAFTAMRARGAQATDVVVLVVAADDGVMPQTREAINHAKAATVPIIVAVNKIDKPGARPDQIRQELSGLGLQPEDWGGDTLFVNVSALTGENVDLLLENIALQTEIMELRASPNVPAEGVVIEAYLDKGRGVVANVLVQNGTLKQGDMMVAGVGLGRIRALTDDRNRRVKSAGPATPVEVLGLPDLPQAGDSFFVVTDQKKAQALVDTRKKAVAAKMKATTPKSLDDLMRGLAAGDVRELPLVIKSDVAGSVEALVKALTELSTDKVKVNVIHTGVGGITENDVMLASASKAIIVAFNVRPAGQAAQVAKSENVEIRTYSIIYEAVDEVKKAMAGLLAPEFKQKDLGRAEVRKVFTIPKVGTVAGSYVLEGQIKRNGKARLVRDSAIIWEGSIGSLRRIKDDVREVTMGFECGIGLDGYNDLNEGDIIECYELEQIAVSL